MKNAEPGNPLDKLEVQKATSEAKEIHQPLTQMFQVREELFGIALKATNAAMWYEDFQLNKSWWSPRAYELFGFAVNEIEPTYELWMRLIHPEDRKQVEENFRSHLDGKEDTWTSEYRYIRKDNFVGWIFDQGFVLRDEAGVPVHILGAMIDITERKTAEEALRKSEERFRAIVETANEGMWTVDAEGRTTFVNRKMAEMLGYQVEEMLGKNFSDFMDDQERKLTAGNLERQEQTIIEQLDIKFQHKDGSEVYALLSTNPLYDNENRYVGLQATITDITERKNLQEQLFQAQKMESIGHLAGSIAHDFNNLLTAILGYSELALLLLKPADKASAKIRQVRLAAERAANLTSQLLAFARKQIIEPKIVSLNALTSNLEMMLRRLIGEDIEFVILPADNLWPVEVDPGQLEQVLVNLCVNARDAMPQGGKLTIETSNTILDENYAKHHFSVKAGEYVMLAVTDTGIGMSESLQERIFEPFFTTKEKDKGTGLGLSTCHGIIKQAGGHISIYSEEGQGTCFKILLPRVISQADIFSGSEIHCLLPGGRETILIVEDEPMVREFAEEALASQGYTVLVAGSGDEALKVSGEYIGAIDLLLTDVVMPYMSGKQLATRLLEQRPQIKVLYVSGYTSNTIVHHGILDAGIAFLQKPYTMGSLTNKTREVLGSP